MPSKKTADRKRISRVLEIADSMGADITVCFDGYAEPGYTNPESGVIALANWNARSYDSPISKADNLMPRLCDLLEKLGVEIEWGDEWVQCAQCGKLVRTSPDSYGWQESYADFDDELVCCDCIKDDPSEYLEHLDGSARNCETIGVDLGAQGYLRVDDDFERGLHEGQADDPKKISKALRAIGINRFIFRLDDVGQFDASFSVWIHESEWELMESHKDDWKRANKSSDVSPAELCKRALQDASVKMVQLQGDGIRIAKCNIGNGTADVKLVSQQDFIDGKALD
jgi:hypothetical protein